MKVTKSNPHCENLLLLLVMIMTNTGQIFMSQENRNRASDTSDKMSGIKYIIKNSKQYFCQTFHKTKIKIRFVVKFVLLDNVNIIIDDTLSHQVTVEASTKPQHLPRAFKCCQNEYIFNFDTKSCTVPQAMARFEKVRHSHLKTLSV